MVPSPDHDSNVRKVLKFDENNMGEEEEKADEEEEKSDLQKLKEKILKARGALEGDAIERNGEKESVLGWLDDKFEHTKMGLEEQLRYLKRHVQPNFTYDFDFADVFNCFF